MKATKKNKSIKAEVIKDINWIQVSGARKSMSTDDITVSFSAKGNKQICYIRVGTDIMKKMNWKEGDAIGIYHDPDDIYHWMICKASGGYRLNHEGKEGKKLRLGFPWDKHGVNFTRSKTVNPIFYKDKITFKVPLEVT